MSEIKLNDKVAWITGASSGIGREVAKKLSKRGAKLILSARREEILNEVAQECEGDNVIIHPMDVTNEEEHQEAVDHIKDRFGQLDLTFFNAGTYSDMPDAIDKDAFVKDIQVNYFGIVYGMEYALPLLQESDFGHVVAMSSATAYGPLPRASSYGASKTAVKYMIESLRYEWDMKDVDLSLSVVCPGFVKTPMTEQNDFPMPFLMEVQEAAKIIVNGIKNQKKEIGFPFGLVMPLKALNLLPAFLYDPLIKLITGVSTNTN